MAFRFKDFILLYLIVVYASLSVYTLVTVFTSTTKIVLSLVYLYIRGVYGDIHFTDF